MERFIAHGRERIAEQCELMGRLHDLGQDGRAAQAVLFNLIETQAFLEDLRIRLHRQPEGDGDARRHASTEAQPA